MSLTGVSNVEGQVATPKDPILNKIRNLASEINKMFDQKAVEASMAASGRTKTFSREAFQISLQGGKTAQGSVYARPR
ncbi:MAG: hypothetical protein HQL07_09410 [Nitrospirae bacterium]|nr:hypothetical protein [Magnetococcales bacterium]HAT50642.1 hypothetical protein [Alphaproteobacteria bacterium]